jgi:hypothetical protein
MRRCLRRFAARPPIPPYPYRGAIGIAPPGSVWGGCCNQNAHALSGRRGRSKAGLGCRDSSGDALFMEEGQVSDFYTRETWRAGGRSKLRKRVNGYGGCKTAPPAFLAAAKLAAIKPGRVNRRLCSSIKRDGTPCRRLAMKGCRGCESHGGILALARQKKFLPSGRTAAFRAAAVEDRTSPAPIELVRLPIYRSASQRTRMRLIRAWQTPAWTTLVRQIQRQDI